MIKKLFQHYRELRFSRRVIGGILLISLIAALTCASVFFVRERKLRMEFASTSQFETLRWSKVEIDKNIELAEELFAALKVDSALFSLVSNFDPSVSSPSNANRKFKEILHTYLPFTTNLCAVQLIRSDVIFYDRNVSFTSIYNIKNSDLIKRARKTALPFWTSTYDFTSEYGHSLLHNAPVNDRYLVSLVGVLNQYHLSQGSLEYLPTDIEKPILIISISESWLKSQLPSCDYEGSSSMLVNTDGQIISHTNEDLRMHSIDGPMLDALKQKTAGFFKQPVSGTDCIVFFNTLENGWKISTVVPVASIMAGIMRDITPVFLTLSLVILILCLLLSLSVSHSLQRPLRQLLNAIEQMEHGDFNVHLPDTHDEFQQVMSGYNKMAQRIDVLMEENYQSRCHERENEMLALRYQTNPHFLYNALNIIHMNAKRAGDAETAALILLLSEIMRYVIRDQRDVVSLQEEIDNVQKYFALINVGYENGIHLEVNVSSEILDCALPKLSIQPLVENAVQHGLSDRIGDGLVRITGLAEGNDMVLTVGDNGKGLKNGTATTSSSGKGAIGIDNVRRRMAFLFEGSELITGTSPLGGLQVTLKLPLRKANMENKYDKS